MSRPASRLAAALGVVGTALFIGSCGGGTHGAASSAASTSTSRSTSTSASVSALPTTSTMRTTSTASHTVHHSSVTPDQAATVGHDGSPAASSGGSGSGGSGGSGSRGAGSGGRFGSSGSGGAQPGAVTSYAQLPATFTITSAGGLDPTAVSLPAVRAVKFSIISRDGRTHRVLLRLTTRARRLTVAGHGRATLLLQGMTPGRYVVDLDGLARGLVLIAGTQSAR